MKPMEVIIKTTKADPGFIYLGEVQDVVIPRIGESISTPWDGKPLYLKVGAVIHDLMDRKIIVVCCELQIKW